MDLSKPLPHPTPTSEPFWKGLTEERVLLQRCDSCQAWIFYPRSHCPVCLSPNLDWQAVSGRGHLYTYTVTHQPTAPHFADEVPQILCMVTLTEGVRLTSTLVNVDVGSISVGMAVKPFFDHVADGTTLLRFQPADA